MARKPKDDAPDPLVWQEKYRARPAHEAKESVYTTTLTDAYIAAEAMREKGWRPLVEQLYGPVYTIPRVEQKR